jgi:hypothetical protein
LCRIYKYFALPSMVTERMKVTYAVIDLTAIKLVDGGNGLEDFWSRWCDCVMRVVGLPKRMVCQHMFADEMRKFKMMVLHVRDYNEMDYDDPNKKWEWVEHKGRACFERQRQRDNHIRTLGVLSGKPTEASARETAVPGVKGGEGFEQWAPPKGQQTYNTSNPGPRNNNTIPPKDHPDNRSHTWPNNVLLTESVGATLPARAR